MFILTKFSDLVQIPPQDFYKKDRDEIEDKINEKYSNKVVQKVGLCICMYDLLKASDGLIGHGTGNVNVNVEFRMIVFRPFKGEIISGRIMGQGPDGIRVSTEFFDDIVVPANMLFENSYFYEKENVWIWPSEESGDCYYDTSDVVRVRIEAETWHDQGPKGPQNPGIGNVGVERSVPYLITASMAEGGLGPTHWW